MGGETAGDAEELAEPVEDEVLATVASLLLVELVVTVTRPV